MPTPEERIQRTINGSWVPLERYAQSDVARSFIAARDAGSVIRNAPWGDFLERMAPLQPALNVQIGQGIAEGLTARTSFDVIDAISQKYAAEQAGKLVSSISETQRGVIRSVIQGAMSGDDTVDTAARKLRQSIGLHPQWAQAVITRHDLVLSNALKAGMTPAAAAKRAEKMSEAYRKKLLRARSMNIARTEIAVANNTGLFASWEHSVRTGVAEPDSRKEWAPGPRACPLCAPISGEVVPWDQPFSNGLMMPPSHPGCRCTGNLLAPDFDDVELDPRAINWLAEDSQGLAPGKAGDFVGGMLLDQATDAAGRAALGAVTTSASDDLLFAYQQGYTIEQELTGGAMAQIVTLGKLKDGTRVVSKQVHTAVEADKEVVAARIYEHIGGKGPRVAKTSDKSVVMDYVDGQVGWDWDNYNTDAPTLEGMLELAGRKYKMQGGREIGLLDWIIDNGDRNGGNYIIKDNLVQPIDHGAAEFRVMKRGWKYQEGDTFMTSSKFTQKTMGLIEDESTGKIVAIDWDASAWTRDELVAIRAKLADDALTAKDHPVWHEFALGRIDALLKTPAKAKAVSRTDELLAAYQDGFTVERELTGGAMADSVLLGKLADGRSVVQKNVKKDFEATNEVLAHAVFEKIGGTGISTARVGPKSVVTDYIDGDTGFEWDEAVQDAWTSDRANFSVEGMRAGVDAKYSMPGARETGLLDYLIRNGDRHGGNFLIKDGTLYPIDHGEASWIGQELGYGINANNPFVRRILGAEADFDKRRVDFAPGEFYTKEELVGIRAKLPELQPIFEAEGHPEYLDAAIERLDNLIERGQW